jgi:hypothetical protein
MVQNLYSSKFIQYKIYTAEKGIISPKILNDAGFWVSFGSNG